MPDFVVLSLGQGASWTAMWVVAGQDVPAQRQGVASGIAATAQQMGAALGLAVLVMVATAPLAASAPADAVREATVVSARMRRIPLAHGR